MRGGVGAAPPYVASRTSFHGSISAGLLNVCSSTLGSWAFESATWAVRGQRVPGGLEPRASVTHTQGRAQKIRQWDDVCLPPPPHQEAPSIAILSALLGTWCCVRGSTITARHRSARMSAPFPPLCMGPGLLLTSSRSHDRITQHCSVEFKSGRLQRPRRVLERRVIVKQRCRSRPAWAGTARTVFEPRPGALGADQHEGPTRFPDRSARMCQQCQ